MWASLFLLCNLALAQTGVVAVNTGRVFNLETDVRVIDAAASSPGRGLIPFDITGNSGVTDSLAVGTHNTAVINAALARVGIHGSTGIWDSIYTPGKPYCVIPGIIWPQKCGCHWVTGGGLKYFLQEEHRGGLIGSVTTLINVGSYTGYMITYYGYGGRIDPMVLEGFPINSQQQWNDAIAGTYGTKVDGGLLIQQPSGTFPTGDLVASMHFVGCTKGVYCSSGGQDDHCEGLVWPYFGADLCTDAYYVDNLQSIGHTFSMVRVGNKNTHFFNFQRGGFLNFQTAIINFPCKFLEIGTPGPNECFYEGHNVRVDNTAEADASFRLVEQVGTTSAPITVVLTGGYCNTAYTTPSIVHDAGATNFNCHALIMNLDSTDADANPW